MAHDKLYGVCENKCFVETYSKEAIDEKVAECQPAVEFGTTEPSSTTRGYGVIGSLYFKIIN